MEEGERSKNLLKFGHNSQECDLLLMIIICFLIIYVVIGLHSPSFSFIAIFVDTVDHRVLLKIPNVMASNKTMKSVLLYYCSIIFGTCSTVDTIHTVCTYTYGNLAEMWETVYDAKKYFLTLHSHNIRDQMSKPNIQYNNINTTCT